MFAGLILAASLSVSPTAQDLLSEIVRLALPVHEAFAKVELEQAALAPAKTDIERLERLGPLDQAGREAMRNVDPNSITPELLRDTGTVAIGEINAHDQANELAVRKMLPRRGWFKISVYGEKAAEAAFLVVQHSFDTDLQLAVLKRMRPLLGTAELEGKNYGLLYDRIAVERFDRPQNTGPRSVAQQANGLRQRLKTRHYWTNAERRLDSKKLRLNISNYSTIDRAGHSLERILKPQACRIAEAVPPKLCLLMAKV